MIGMPYMGSKRKIAKQLVDFMLQAKPKAKYVYDLFGGGGAMSFEFLNRWQIETVYYNELNTGITELLKKIKTDGVTSEFYQWVDRETFHKHKHDTDWRGGLLATCWSFGSNQGTYLYGKDKEHSKKLLHDFIVNKDLKAREEFYQQFGVWLDDELISDNDIQRRRLKVRSFISKSIKGRSDIEHLGRMQHIENAQHLKSIQEHNSLDNLVVSNLSYEDVKIDTPKEETVIYLDPPYAEAGSYKETIDHNRLLEWIKDNDYTVFVSEYNLDLPVALELKHRSTLSAINNSKKVIERLFTNKELD